MHVTKMLVYVMQESRWVRILKLNVESRYLNSPFCILTLMPFFLHWMYWWGILVSNMRSQAGVLQFLSPPSASSLPLSSTFSRKSMNGIYYGKSPKIVTCSSEVLEFSLCMKCFWYLPILNTFHNWHDECRAPSVSQDLVVFLVYQ